MKAPRIKFPNRLRHHIGLIVAIPLAISGLLVLVVMAPSWMGWPTATNSLALLPLVFGAPLLASVQAYESARLEDSAVAATWVSRTNSVKVRENMRSLAGSWIAAAVCAALWYGAARVVTEINSQVHAPASIRPLLGYSALAMLAVASGHLVGKLPVPMAIAVGAAFALCLAVSIYATQYTNTHPALVTPIMPIAALGIGAVIATASALFAPFGPGRGWAPVGIAVLLAAGVITAATSSEKVVLNTEVDEVCEEAGRTTICMWGEHQAALGPLTEISQSVQSAAPDAMELPARINEFGLDGTVDVSGSLNLDNAAIRNRASLTIAYVLTLSNHTFAGHDNSAAGSQARSELEALLVVAACPNISDGEAALGYLSQVHLDEARKVVQAGETETRDYAIALYQSATKDLQ